jgi:hypothetical protein
MTSPGASRPPADLRELDGTTGAFPRNVKVENGWSIIAPAPAWAGALPAVPERWGV